MLCQTSKCILSPLKFLSPRAASTESDTAAEVPGETRGKPSVGRGGAGLQRKGSLMRKTLSLEQTSNAHEQVSAYFFLLVLTSCFHNHLMTFLSWFF